MKKRVTLIIVTAFIISSFIGFNNKSEISMLYRGEGDLWEVEFWFPKTDAETISYYFILRSKDDMQEPVPDTRLIMGFLWLHEAAELISVEDPETLITDIILNDKIKLADDSIRFFIYSPEVISAYKIIRSDDVINNTNEYKSSQTINKKQLENMSTDIEFAVKWGDKTERIKVTKTR